MRHDANYLQAIFDGYKGNLSNRNLTGERIISAGRAAGLAWELGNIKTAQAIWDSETARLSGMPTFVEFRVGYEKYAEAFKEFEPGVNDFPKEGTAFSYALGAYARGLEYAANAKEPAGEDSPAYWAGEWAKDVLIAAGFPEQAAQLKQAIVSGVALPSVKSKSIE